MPWPRSVENVRKKLMYWSTHQQEATLHFCSCVMRCSLLCKSSSLKQNGLSALHVILSSIRCIAIACEEEKYEVADVVVKLNNDWEEKRKLTSKSHALGLSTLRDLVTLLRNISKSMNLYLRVSDWGSMVAAILYSGSYGSGERGKHFASLVMLRSWYPQKYLNSRI